MDKALFENSPLISLIKKIPSYESGDILTIQKEDLVSLSNIQFLQLFNVLDIENHTDNSFDVKPISKSAFGFLASIEKYLENDLSLISSWDNIPSKNDPTLSEGFNLGGNFLYEMEKKRFNLFKDKTPTDFRKLNLFLIKAKLEDSDDDYYLMQYSVNTRMVQMLGGYTKVDKITDEYLLDHLSQELPFTEFTEENTSFTKVLEGIKNYAVAKRTNLLTEYSIDFYHVDLKMKEISLSSNDVWVTRDELLEKITSDGQSIMWPRSLSTNKDTTSLLTGLQLSIIKPQKIRSNSREDLVEDSSNRDLIKKLIESEESSSIEFKSSIRWDYRLEKKNKALEKVIAKSICGFLNSGGGTLIIGVDDNNKVLGIEKDLKTLKKQNNDGYLQFITEMIATRIGLEFIPLITITFETFENKDICIITIVKATEPVFLSISGENIFCIRATNSTRILDSQATFKFINKNWMF